MTNKRLDGTGIVRLLSKAISLRQGDTDCCNNNADDRQNEYPRRQFVRLFNEPGNGCSSEQALVADGVCSTCYDKAGLLRIAPTKFDPHDKIDVTLAKDASDDKAELRSSQGLWLSQKN